MFDSIQDGVANRRPRPLSFHHRNSPTTTLRRSPMIIVDNALKARAEQGKPIRVGLLGAGFMAQGLTNMIVNSVPGMRMVAVFNRHIKKAFHIYDYSGLTDIVAATTQGQVEDAIRAGKPVVTEDAFLLARSEQIDVLVDTTRTSICSDRASRNASSVTTGFPARMASST